MVEYNEVKNIDINYPKWTNYLNDELLLQYKNEYHITFKSLIDKVVELPIDKWYEYYVVYIMYKEYSKYNTVFPYGQGLKHKDSPLDNINFKTPIMKKSLKSKTRVWSIIDKIGNSLYEIDYSYINMTIQKRHKDILQPSLILSYKLFNKDITQNIFDKVKDYIVPELQYKIRPKGEYYKWTETTSRMVYDYSLDNFDLGYYEFYQEMLQQKLNHIRFFNINGIQLIDDYGNDILMCNTKLDFANKGYRCYDGVSESNSGTEYKYIINGEIIDTVTIDGSSSMPNINRFYNRLNFIDKDILFEEYLKKQQPLYIRDFIERTRLQPKQILKSVLNEYPFKATDKNYNFVCHCKDVIGNMYGYGKKEMKFVYNKYRVDIECLCEYSKPIFDMFYGDCNKFIDFFEYTYYEAKLYQKIKNELITKYKIPTVTKHDSIIIPNTQEYIDIAIMVYKSVSEDLFGGVLKYSVEYNSNT